VSGVGEVLGAKARPDFGETDGNQNAATGDADVSREIVITKASPADPGFIRANPQLAIHGHEKSGRKSRCRLIVWGE
jgi:hypothetical protein